MSFQINYVGGGSLDKIRSIGHLDSGRLDAPYMPMFTLPYIVGSQIECANEDTSFIDKMAFDSDVELLSISMDTNLYEPLDTWEVYIGGINIIEQVAYKKYPEGIQLIVAHLIPAGTEIKFVFRNNSATKKLVWYHYQFLCGQSVNRVPVKEEQPPVIETIPPQTIFYEDLPKNLIFTFTGEITDDTGVAYYTASLDGEQKINTDCTPIEKLVTLNMGIPIDVPPIPKPPEVDVVFLFDTSGSMGDDIINVKTNLGKFKQVLIDKGLEVYMGHLNSNPNELARQPLINANEFNLDAIKLDKGDWESLNWNQFTNETYGIASYFDEFHEGSIRYAIFITDTNIKVSYPQSFIDKCKELGVIVTGIHQLKHHDYDTLISQTKGMNLNIADPDFSNQLISVADDILSKVPEEVPQTKTFFITAKDNLGLKATKQVTITFKHKEGAVKNG